MARHFVSDSAPPCERGANHRDRCECLVATVREGGERVANMLSKLAQSMIVASCGPQMAAVVFDKGTDECFLVVRQPLSTTTAAVASLKARIEKLPHPPKVKSVEPLNRRLQARLGWGDARFDALTRPALMDALSAKS